LAKRNCSNCGQPGHRAPNCPDGEVDREEMKRQRSMPKPKMIHIANTNGYLCKSDLVEWPTRCDDAFAQTLPRCEDCEQAYRKHWGRDPPTWPPVIIEKYK